MPDESRVIPDPERVTFEKKLVEYSGGISKEETVTSEADFLCSPKEQSAIVENHIFLPEPTGRHDEFVHSSPACSGDGRLQELPFTDSSSEQYSLTEEQKPTEIISPDHASANTHHCSCAEGDSNSERESDSESSNNGDPRLLTATFDREQPVSSSVESLPICSHLDLEEVPVYSTPPPEEVYSSQPAPEEVSSSQPPSSVYSTPASLQSVLCCSFSKVQDSEAPSKTGGEPESYNKLEDDTPTPKQTEVPNKPCEAASITTTRTLTMTTTPLVTMTTTPLVVVGQQLAETASTTTTTSLAQRTTSTPPLGGHQQAETASTTTAETASTTTTSLATFSRAIPPLDGRTSRLEKRRVSLRLDRRSLARFSLGPNFSYISESSPVDLLSFCGQEERGRRTSLLLPPLFVGEEGGRRVSLSVVPSSFLEAEEAGRRVSFSSLVPPSFLEEGPFDFEFDDVYFELEIDEEDGGKEEEEEKGSSEWAPVSLLDLSLPEIFTEVGNVDVAEETVDEEEEEEEEGGVLQSPLGVSEWSSGKAVSAGWAISRSDSFSEEMPCLSSFEGEDELERVFGGNVMSPLGWGKGGRGKGMAELPSLDDSFTFDLEAFESLEMAMFEEGEETELLTGETERRELKGEVEVGVVEVVEVVSPKASVAKGKEDIRSCLDFFSISLSHLSSPLLSASPDAEEKAHQEKGEQDTTNTEDFLKPRNTEEAEKGEQEEEQEEDEEEGYPASRVQTIQTTAAELSVSAEVKETDGDQAGVEATERETDSDQAGVEGKSMSTDEDQAGYDADGDGEEDGEEDTNDLDGEELLPPPPPPPLPSPLLTFDSVGEYTLPPSPLVYGDSSHSRGKLTRERGYEGDVDTDTSPDDHITTIDVDMDDIVTIDVDMDDINTIDVDMDDIVTIDVDMDTEPSDNIMKESLLRLVPNYLEPTDLVPMQEEDVLEREEEAVEISLLEDEEVEVQRDKEKAGVEEEAEGKGKRAREGITSTEYVNKVERKLKANALHRGCSIASRTRREKGREMEERTEQGSKKASHPEEGKENKGHTESKMQQALKSEEQLGGPRWKVVDPLSLVKSIFPSQQANTPISKRTRTRIGEGEERKRGEGRQGEQGGQLQRGKSSFALSMSIIQ
jgi:hypothetical protein